MSKLQFCVKRLTTCDSGNRFNPLMHVFIFLTFAFGLFMLIGDASVMQTALYTETANVGTHALNLWGGVAVVSAILHVVGLLLRGRVGIQMMRAAMFGGFFVWLWAVVIYLQGAYWLHFAVNGLPNLLFWAWYAWQWRKRYHSVGDPNVSAFVN